MSRTKLTRGDRRAVRLACLMLASLPLAAWLTAPAKADPASDAYALRYSGVVCQVLNQYPTFAGINGIAEGIHNDGLSYYQSGEVIATAVIYDCPKYLPLLDAWVKSATAPAAPVWKS